MRKNFAQILRDFGEVDLDVEYERIHNLFYHTSVTNGAGDNSIYGVANTMFFNCYFRGTSLTLEEFDEENEFSFHEMPTDVDLDTLVLFCEYCFNISMFVASNGYPQIQLILAQITKLIEKIGYMQSNEGGLITFVEKSQSAIAVAEIVPESVSYKVISYNHHSMRGNLDAKKQTLLILADLLEPKRGALESIERQFASDLFYAFNNFNIRHNNIDPAGPKYKKPIGDLTKEQLEHWYDEIYQMCLLAFLRLEHIERKNNFDVLKSQIEGT